MERAVVVCHKLTNDGGALAMMCGKNEEHQLSAIARWKITMTYAHYKAMDTHYQW